MKRRRKGYGRGVGAAPTQGGVVVVFVDALEAGDNDDSPMLQLVHNPVCINAL